MTIKDLNQDNFSAAVGEGGVLVVDFTAASCGACTKFEPVFARISERFPSVMFGKVDAEAEAALISELAISHIPCLVIYRDEFVLFKQAGNFSEAQVEQLISTAVGLDMEQLRASVSDETEQKATSLMSSSNYRRYADVTSSCSSIRSTSLSFAPRRFWLSTKHGTSSWHETRKS